MKISTYILMFLAIAGFMFVFGLMSQEAKTYYPDAGINDTEWRDKYDYSSEINESTKPIQTALENIGDEDKGWFVKILSGIAAIPAAVIGLASLVLDSFTHGASLVTGGLETLNIPATLIAIIIVMIIVWGVIKLVEVYQKWQI